MSIFFDIFHTNMSRNGTWAFGNSRTKNLKFGL